MSWSAGVFTRTYGSNGWVNDKNAGTKILASRHDTNDDDLATGINACLTRDGTAKPAANFLPNVDSTYALGSATYRWTSAYVATSVVWQGGTYATTLNYGTPTANQTVSLPNYTGTLITSAEVQNQAAVALTSVSGTNTIAGTATPTPSAYAAGQAFEFIPAATNTGATTLNVSSLGAKNVYSNGAACVGGEITINVPVRVYYDGTQFNLIGGATAAQGSSWALIQSQTAPGGAGVSSIDFTTGINTTYNHYCFLINGLVPSTSTDDLWLRISTDGGSTWPSGGTDYRHSRLYFDSQPSGVTAPGANIDSKIVLATGMYVTGGTGLDGRVWLSNPGDGTFFKSIRGDLSYFTNPAAAYYSNVLSGGSYLSATTAINGIRFKCSTGNIKSGTIALYGIKKS